MPRTVLRRPVYLLFVAASLAVRAQDLKLPDTPEVLNVAPAPSERFPAKWYPRVGDGTDIVPAPVLANPYTGVVETVSTYQSPTGESLRQVAHGFTARDRFGRTRAESQNGGMTINGEMIPTKTITVADPVSHCEFHWLELTTGTIMPPEMRSAFVTCRPQTLRYKDMNLFDSLFEAKDGTSTHGDTTTVTEHLPPKQIDGVTVNRLRVSNSRRDEQGQDRHWSTETWYSPDLQELIRLGDEESGTTTLTEIHRVDPDPALFYPPDGYTIELQPAR